MGVAHETRRQQQQCWMGLGMGPATTQSLNLLSHAYGLQCMSALKADPVWWTSPHMRPAAHDTPDACAKKTHLACHALLFSPQLPKLLLSGLMIRLHPPQRAVCRTDQQTHRRDKKTPPSKHVRGHIQTANQARPLQLKCALADVTRTSHCLCGVMCCLGKDAGCFMVCFSQKQMPPADACSPSNAW